MFRPLFAAALAAALAAPALADAPKAAPLVEKYLLEGKLADGEKALTARLADHPKDDQARFGLAIVQFLRGVERLGGGLHRYGFKVTSQFPTIPGLPRLVSRKSAAGQAHLPAAARPGPGVGQRPRPRCASPRRHQRRCGQVAAAGRPHPDRPVRPG
ncbi:MAG: hypothetical protein U0736_03215 [Gemmataceae bacterium]